MEQNVWNTIVGIVVIFLGFILFGLFNPSSNKNNSPKEIQEVKQIDDIVILKWSVSEKKDYHRGDYDFFNLSLLYTGPINEKDDKYRIVLRIRQIHRVFENCKVLIYNSREGFECYEIEKFDGECLEFKDDVLSYSIKKTGNPELDDYNYYKFMKSTGVLKEYSGIQYDLTY